MKKYLFSIFLFSILFFSQVFFAHAEVDFPNTIDLTKLPGTSTPTVIDPKTTSPMQYINTIYNVGLAVGGILAIAMITAGGLMYSISGAMDKRKEGKDMIVNALLGLGILMGSYLILKTINPNLVTLVDFGAYFDNELEVDGCPMGQATTTIDIFENGVTSTQVICTSTGELLEIGCGDDWSKIPIAPQDSGHALQRNAATQNEYGQYVGCTQRKITFCPTGEDLEFDDGNFFKPFYDTGEEIDTADCGTQSAKSATIWQYPYFIDLRNKEARIQFARYCMSDKEECRKEAGYLKWYNPLNPEKKVGYDEMISDWMNVAQTFEQQSNIIINKIPKYPVSEPVCLIYAYQERSENSYTITPLRYWLNFCSGGLLKQSMSSVGIEDEGEAEPGTKEQSPTSIACTYNKNLRGQEAADAIISYASRFVGRVSYSLAARGTSCSSDKSIAAAKKSCGGLGHPGGPLCYDCSGFVREVYRCTTGINMPWSTISYTSPSSISSDISEVKNFADLMPGDTFGWRATGKAGMNDGHVMIVYSRNGNGPNVKIDVHGGKDGCSSNAACGTGAIPFSKIASTTKEKRSFFWHLERSSDYTVSCSDPTSNIPCGLRKESAYTNQECVYKQYDQYGIGQLSGGCKVISR